MSMPARPACRGCAGSLVQFQSPDEIRRSYPDCVWDLADGGTLNTTAVQGIDIRIEKRLNERKR